MTAIISILSRLLLNAAVLFVFLTCAAANVFGCSCGVEKPFLEIVKDADLIIVGKTTEYHGEHKFSDGSKVRAAVDVTIEKLLKGASDAEQIRVWGDNGALCRPYISKFPLKTTWVLALRIEKGTNAGPGQYYVSVCGEYSLQVEDEKVVGRISNSQETSVSLSELSEIIALSNKQGDAKKP